MKKEEIAIKYREQKNRVSLTLMFSVVIFFILLIAISISALAVNLLVEFEIIGSSETLKTVHITVLMAAISGVIGIGISFLLIKFPLKPVNRIINHINKLAAGDYSARLEYGGMLAAVPSLAELSESFNTLATELGNTEMLRSDFINDFSHEFKTPIVSIVGFARLLKSDQLTEEERRQYIQAIEEESMRLSLMSTNILNLTKVENQTILNEVSEFNLSEQIRSCILLLEKEWDKKALELQVDFDEYTVTGNEELLKQVWINLIGNAVKFTPRCGTVSVDISDEGENIKVDVSNTGSEIPSDKINKIWTKFYQADESRSTEGNGIGLPIVKRIVELHSGRVSVKSENSVTVFSVVLPKNVTKG